MESSIDPSKLRIPQEEKRIDAFLKKTEICDALSELENKKNNLQEYFFLSNGICLTETRAPEITGIIESLKKWFKIDYEITPYILSHYDEFASVVEVKPEFYYIVLSTKCLEILEIDEIRFILAHEVAHIAFNHLKLKKIKCDNLPSLLSEELFFLKRQGEISADIAAGFFTESHLSARKAMHKLVIGRCNKYIDMSADEDLSQLEEINKLLDDQRNLFDIHSSHPTSVVRMLILKLIEDFRCSQHQVNLEFSKLHEDSLSIYRKSFPKVDKDEDILTIIAAFWVSFADDGFNIDERKEVAKLCTGSQFDDYFQLCKDKELPSLFWAQYFEENLNQRKIPTCKKVMLLQKIVHVARSDGNIGSQEASVIADVCKLLSLDKRFAEKMLS